MKAIQSNPHIIESLSCILNSTFLLHREKRRDIKRMKTSIIKMEHYKIFKLFKDSTVSNFVTKK